MIKILFFDLYPTSKGPFGGEGGSGRLLLHIYFNFDPIGPENTATTKKLDFKISFDLRRS
jgi:hypothetical protein